MMCHMCGGLEVEKEAITESLVDMDMSVVFGHEDGVIRSSKSDSWPDSVN